MLRRPAAVAASPVQQAAWAYNRQLGATRAKHVPAENDASSGLWLGSWVRFLMRTRLAPFVPTPNKVGMRLLSLAELQPGETLVDLGSGDGRLLRLAVTKFGAACAIGYELDASLVGASREAADALAPALSERIVVHQDDIFEAVEALRSADVVSLYLSDRGNASLLPLLRQTLAPTARVVSFVWEMPPEVQRGARTILMEGSGAPMHLFVGLGKATGASGGAEQTAAAKGRD